MLEMHFKEITAPQRYCGGMQLILCFEKKNPGLWFSGEGMVGSFFKVPTLIVNYCIVEET